MTEYTLDMHEGGSLMREETRVCRGNPYFRVGTISHTIDLLIFTLLIEMMKSKCVAHYELHCKVIDGNKYF